MKIDGTDGIAPRGFADSTGQEHTRPFALGSDMGFGGMVGLLAAPAVFALLSLSRNRKLKVAASVMAAGVVMAVVTSQARVAIVGGRGRGHRLHAARDLVTPSFPIDLGLRCGHCDRIRGSLRVGIRQQLAPVRSVQEHRTQFGLLHCVQLPNWHSERLPTYMVNYPLGAGLGTVGPASTALGSGGNHTLDAESEPTYLLIELGIPGLVVLLAFQLRVIKLSVAIRRG